MILIIAEKPDMGRKIATALGGFKQEQGYLKSEHYYITWAFGHLVSLAEPDDYEERFKMWNFDDLPIVPKQFRLVPNKDTQKQLSLIKKLALSSSSIINCTDAGREGEAIFRYIYEYLELRLPFQRLWISSLTKEAITQGFRNLKDGSEYDNLYKAARSRSTSDWLIGMNGTRAFTTKFGGSKNVISIGRVQTPVLAMIYDRHQEITMFKSRTYYTVVVELQQQQVNYSGTLHIDEPITEKLTAEKIAQTVQGKIAKTKSYESKEALEKPPLLYDLGLLQTEANKKFGYTAKQTADIAQQLYEQLEAISYPRTTSNYVAADNLAVMHEIFDLFKNSKYSSFTINGDKCYVNSENKNLCRPDKIEDHHAIFPTEKIPHDLTKDQENIYSLIVKRFLTHFYPPAKYKLHRILCIVDQFEFKTNIKELISLGWKIINEEKNNNKNTEDKGDKSTEDYDLRSNFAFNEEELAVCTKANGKTIETKPPGYFTEGSLIDAMKKAGKHITNAELKSEMSYIQLGTPATRTEIIENLKRKQYIIVDGKKLKPTDKGNTLVEMLRNLGLNVLTSPEMTAKWEQRLSEIAVGSASDIAFSQVVVKFTEKIISCLKNGTSTISQAKFMNTIGNCPKCKNQSIIAERFAYLCTSTECGFKINSMQYGKELTSKNISDLLTSGKTNTISFKNKSGKAYKAKLMLDAASMNGKLTLEFVNKNIKR